MARAETATSSRASAPGAGHSHPAPSRLTAGDPATPAHDTGRPITPQGRGGGLRTEHVVAPVQELPAAQGDSDDRPARRRRRSQRGASSLELAILAPAILGLIFISVQTALWLYARSVALNAAQEGVSRLRLVQPTVYTGGVGEKVRLDILAYTQQLAGTTLQKPGVDPPLYNNPPGMVSFTVTGESVSLIPGVVFRIERTATGPIEEFEADDK